MYAAGRTRYDAIEFEQDGSKRREAVELVERCSREPHRRTPSPFPPRHRRRRQRHAATATIRPVRVHPLAQIGRFRSSVGTGCSRGTHRVLARYSQGNRAVLTRYSRGTHRLLAQYSIGYSRGTHGRSRRYSRGTQIDAPEACRRGRVGSDKVRRWEREVPRVASGR